MFLYKAITPVINTMEAQPKANTGTTRVVKLPNNTEKIKEKKVPQGYGCTSSKFQDKIELVLRI